MSRQSTLFAFAAALAASVSLPAHADQMFNRIAGFAVANNLPGDIEKTTPTIINVDGDGAIKQEISLPVELPAGQTRFGLEGITTVGEGDDLMLIMPMQREWGDDPKGQVKLLA